ncbi:MAG: hypothetical protein KJI69_04470 [Patescibacteria group bacterium]|nr:hypothetical protein [Patescibacteria group bacterium]
MKTKFKNYHNVKTIEQAINHNDIQTRKINKDESKIKIKYQKIENLKNVIKKIENEITDLEHHPNLRESYVLDENNHYGYNQVLELSKVEKVAICTDRSGSIHYAMTIFKLNGKWFKVETRIIDPNDHNSKYTNKLLQLTNEELYWS